MKKFYNHIGAITLSFEYFPDLLFGFCRYNKYFIFYVHLLDLRVRIYRFKLRLTCFLLFCKCIAYNLNNKYQSAIRTCKAQSIYYIIIINWVIINFDKSVTWPFKAWLQLQHGLFFIIIIYWFLWRLDCEGRHPK